MRPTVLRPDLLVFARIVGGTQIHPFASWPDSSSLRRFNRPVPGVAFPPGQFFIHSVLGYRGVVLQVCPFRRSFPHIPLSFSSFSLAHLPLAHEGDNRQATKGPLPVLGAAGRQRLPPRPPGARTSTSYKPIIPAYNAHHHPSRFAPPQPTKQPLRISVTNLPLAPADDSVGPRGVAHDASVPRRDHFLYLVLPDVNDYPQAARGSHFYVSADHLMAFTPTEAVPVANPKFRQVCKTVPLFPPLVHVLAYCASYSSRCICPGACCRLTLSDSMANPEFRQVHT